MLKNVKLGSDPEVFLNKDDEIFSVIGLLGGSKEHPMDIGNGCSVQEDNILAEFNIPPASDKKSFIDSINYGKDYISLVMAAYGAELHFSSSEVVSDEVLEEDKAKEFGCEPSMNAITQSIRSVEIKDGTPVEIRNLRSSGFHIHIGYDGATEEMNERLVLAFELMVSMPLTWHDNDLYHRRNLYGLHGEYRDKAYGVECRSVGGYFISDDQWIGKVYDLTMSAIELAGQQIDTEELRQMCEHCLEENNKVNYSNLKEAHATIERVYKVKPVEITI